MFYSVSFKIPSQNKNWEFKSINTLQQKEICKVMLMNDDQLLIDTFNQIIVQCLNPKYDFNLLTLLDKLLILIKLRWESIGDSIDIEIEKDSKKYNSTYSLVEIAEKFYIASQEINILQIEEKNIKILCSLPRVQDEFNFLQEISQSDATYDSIIYYFINEIKIDEINYNLTALEIKEILNNLPAHIYQKILSYVKFCLDRLYKVIIYSYLEEEIYFNYNKNYIDFIKFIFKEDLYGIYQDIYILNKTANFNSEYVDSMSPLERQLYISFIVQEKQQNSKVPPTQEEVKINSPSGTFDTYMNQMGG